MSENFFWTKSDKPDMDEHTSSEESRLSAEEFFREHGRAIEDYAGDSGLTFKRGKGWAIIMETGEVTYNPNFFTEKGYSPAECMWATSHEVEHFRNWRKDPEAYAKLHARMASRRRIHVLYNCLDDIMVNQEVDKRFPARAETKNKLYREKLFPNVDYSREPKHLQFAYAILRERMLPEEVIVIDPEVRLEVEKLKNIDGQGTDLISLVADPGAKPGDRFDVIRDYIEPIFERFFQEDAQKQKEKEAGEGGEPSKSAEDYFEADYDEFDKNSPDIIPDKDIKDTLNKFSKQDKAPEQIANEQFKKEHGVSPAEVDNYRLEYEKIKKYIEPLREIFERIISTRKAIKRRLKERTDQGVIVDPSLISQAYIDVKGGVLDSRTQLRVKKEEHDEHRPNDFEFTLVCDLSGSMNDDNPGGKSYEQKLCVVLVMEALSEFEEKLKAERLEKSVDLKVAVEARGFGESDEELKPMGGEIDYKTRVKIASRLSRCDGGSTRDYLSLEQINKRMTEEVKRKIIKSDLKKVVLLITDGGSADVNLAVKERNKLVEAGVVAKAIQIGEVSAGERKSFLNVWRKDGEKCQNVFQLTEVVEKLLAEFLNNL